MTQPKTIREKCEGIISFDERRIERSRSFLAPESSTCADIARAYLELESNEKNRDGMYAAANFHLDELREENQRLKAQVAELENRQGTGWAKYDELRGIFEGHVTMEQRTHAYNSAPLIKKLYGARVEICRLAADEIILLRAQVERLTKALEFYAEGGGIHPSDIEKIYHPNGHEDHIVGLKAREALSPEPKNEVKDDHPISEDHESLGIVYDLKAQIVALEEQITRLNQELALYKMSEESRKDEMPW